MKSLRFVLPVVLMSLATVAFAQHDAHKATDDQVGAGAAGAGATAAGAAGRARAGAVGAAMP